MSDNNDGQNTVVGRSTLIPLGLAIVVATGLAGLALRIESSLSGFRSSQDVMLVEQRHMKESIDEIREDLDNGQKDRWTRADMRAWVENLERLNREKAIVVPSVR